MFLSKESQRPSQDPQASKMESFVTIVNGCLRLTILGRVFIVDVCGVLTKPLGSGQCKTFLGKLKMIGFFLGNGLVLFIIWSFKH